jgi:carbohydrate diacid regulator
MSNRLFQGLVHQMRETIHATVGVVDETATIIACSDLTKIGTSNEFVSLDLSDVHDIFIRDGYTYKPFGSRTKPEYAVFVEGVDDAAAKYASILASIMMKNMTATTSLRMLYWIMFCRVILSSKQENCISAQK